MTQQNANGNRLTSDGDADISSEISKKKRKRIGAAAKRRRLDNKLEETGEEEEEELVVSLSFTTAQKHKPPENSVVLSAEEEGVRRRRGTCRSHGSVSLIGRRREMEDAVAVELGLLSSRGAKEYDFFGVYDGHGGSHVAHACRDRLNRLLVERLVEEEDEQKGEIEWDRVMKEAFDMMDSEVNTKGAAVATMGSTAVVAVVGAEEVVVANCGDSRAVLSRNGVAIPLSDDHKPDRDDELERIESCGGKVINWNGHRVLGVLATSRSIGDKYLKPFVIPDPEVVVSKRVDTDEFIILASDGLWDEISNKAACQIVRRCLNGKMGEIVSKNDQFVAEESRAAEAAAVLAEVAIARGSRDNISIVIVDLRNS